MKTFLIANLLFTGALFANSTLSISNDEGVTHFVEPIETPVAVIKQLERGDFLETYVSDPTPEVIIDSIINLGQKIWKIIEKGKPVSDVRSLYANALPEGVRSSRDLDSWSDLQHESFRMSGKNLYGVTVYDTTYTVVHRYNGKYQGKGRYLADVSVVPHSVDLKWGFTLNFNVADISTVNVGTRENPIASMLMELQFEVNSTLNTRKMRIPYQFRGDDRKVRMAAR